MNSSVPLRYRPLFSAGAGEGQGKGVIGISGLSRGAVCSFLVVIGLLMVVTAGASADTEIGTHGSAAGQVNGPKGVAVDQSLGLLYVADEGNARIDVFDASTGSFTKAFGWGVLDGSPTLQVCTSACLPGIPGTGAGQLAGSRVVSGNRLRGVKGIAVDNDPGSPNYHSVYVRESDNENSRVQRFDQNGAFVWMVGGGVDQTTDGNLCASASGDTCGAGKPGEAPEQLGDVFLGGVAIGPGGTVYAADRLESGIPTGRVQEFEPDGAIAQTLLLPVAGGSGRLTALAVATSGDMYVSTAAPAGAVRKYSPGGSELLRFDPSSELMALATAGTKVIVGENYEDGGEGVNSYALLEFEPDGTQKRALYGPALPLTPGFFVTKVNGLASYPSPSGSFFASEEPGGPSSSGVRYLTSPAPGPVVPAIGTKSTEVGNLGATLVARVDPEGEPTSFSFEYIDDASFQADGGAFGPGKVLTPSEALPPPDDFPSIEQCRVQKVAEGGGTFVCELRPATLRIGGLTPDTVYHFRVVASNASGVATGPATTFRTEPPVIFGEASTTQVEETSATINTEADPFELPAQARFLLLDESTYDANGEQFGADSIQLPPEGSPAINLEVGKGPQVLSQALSNLNPATKYVFTLVVTDACAGAAEPDCTLFGPVGRFEAAASPEAITNQCANASYRSGLGALLPDCRAYELVTPVDKNGANIEAVTQNIGWDSGLDQAAADGQSFTYSTYKAFGDVQAGPYTNQYLARRGATGWVTEAISPIRTSPSLMTFDSEQLDRQYKAFSSDLCEAWFVQDAEPSLTANAIPGFPGLYRRDNCSGGGGLEALTTVEPPDLEPRQFRPELQGVAVDGAVALVRISDNLTSDAPPQPSQCVGAVKPTSNVCESRLYTIRNGQPTFVCILPSGLAFEGNCTAGTPGREQFSERDGSLQNAISSDGSIIYWTAVPEEPVNEPDRLYVRVNGSRTVAVSSPAATVGRERARFYGAAPDGSTALFSEGEELFDFSLSGESSTLIARDVLGVAGVSEDAAAVYFASTEALTGSERNSGGQTATSGEANLYFYRRGAPLRFVGILPPGETEKGSVLGINGTAIALEPIWHLARTAPNGEQLVFMSTGRLTGYNNADAASGEPDLEVFEYDAAAKGGSGWLRCLSCNPTGSRPTGELMSTKVVENRWAAGQIPSFESQLYGQRVIADDGNRVYFESSDRLLQRDTNGQQDVYQWEAVGSGGCTDASGGFRRSSEGCISLISTGTSPQPSELVDISADGSDVFFKTNQSLVPQDHGLVDIYDARVGGGLPNPPEEVTPCEGEECQQRPSPPGSVQPSSGNPGPGNPRAQKPRCPKGTHRVTKKQKKPRCVKSDGSHNRKHHGKTKQHGQKHHGKKRHQSSKGGKS